MATAPTLPSHLPALDLLPALAWTTDSRMRIESVSGGALSTIGPELADALPGRTLADAGVSPEAIAAHQQAIAGHAAAYLAQWQGRLWACRVAPASWSGTLVGVRGCAVDVTDAIPRDLCRPDPALLPQMIDAEMVRLWRPRDALVRPHPHLRLLP